MVNLRAAQWFMAVSLVLMFLVLAVDHCARGESWFYVYESPVVEPASPEQMDEWKRDIWERIRSQREA